MQAAVLQLRGRRRCALLVEDGRCVVLVGCCATLQLTIPNRELPPSLPLQLSELWYLTPQLTLH